MARRVKTQKRVFRRPPSVRDGMRKAPAFMHRLLARPRALMARASALLAPFNPRTKRRLRRAAADMMAAARELQGEYAATQAISFAMVYRLEAAHAALIRATAARTGRRSIAKPPPDNQRTRMASALLQVAHLAQVAREWQQDIINLQHSLATEDLLPDQRDALTAGMGHLQGYVRQNMHDLDRWLQAAEKLNGR